jgi:hypothetical protein
VKYFICFELTSHGGTRTLGNNSMEKETEHVPDVTADIELSMNKFFLNELEEGEENLVKMQQIR